MSILKPARFVFAGEVESRSEGSTAEGNKGQEDTSVISSENPSGDTTEDGTYGTKLPEPEAAKDIETVITLSFAGDCTLGSDEVKQGYINSFPF